MSDQDVQGSLEKAASLINRRRYAEAMQAYQKIVDLTPQCGEAWSRLGSLNHQRGDFSQAETCYRSAIKLDKNDVNAISGWCAVLPTIQRPPETYELITQLIDNPPVHSEGCFLIAMLCSTLGRHADALDIIDIAIKKAPGVDKHILLRADILARWGNFEEAFDILKPYLEAANPIPGAVLVFSNFCHVVELQNECIRLFEKVRDSTTTSPAMRAEIVKAMGRVRNTSLG